ncbi:MAG: hypothetical protein ACP5LO_09480 [Calditerrivibrio sp.]|uniref:hypothetical protein n=1 Tax=Calditerrivibrio sp. TaxID=2792612 RepID=UPI003D129DE1
MVYSKIRKSLLEDTRIAMYKLGKGSFFITTLINIFVGFWFLYSHEAKIFNLLMDNNMLGTFLLWIVVVLAVISVVFIKKIPDSLLIISLKADPYWGIFILFMLLFVALLITLYYGIVRVYKDIKQ